MVTLLISGRHFKIKFIDRIKNLLALVNHVHAVLYSLNKRTFRQIFLSFLYKNYLECSHFVSSNFPGVLNEGIALPFTVHHLLFKIQDGVTISRELVFHTGFLDLHDI